MTYPAGNNRVTRVTLEVAWNDRVVDHPVSWPWTEMLATMPDPVRVVMVTEVADIDDEGNIIQSA